MAVGGCRSIRWRAMQACERRPCVAAEAVHMQALTHSLGPLPRPLQRCNRGLCPHPTPERACQVVTAERLSSLDCQLEGAHPAQASPAAGSAGVGPATPVCAQPSPPHHMSPLSLEHKPALPCIPTQHCP